MTLAREFSKTTLAKETSKSRGTLAWQGNFQAKVTLAKTAKGFSKVTLSNVDSRAAKETPKAALVKETSKMTLETLFVSLASELL